MRNSTRVACEGGRWRRAGTIGHDHASYLRRGLSPVMVISQTMPVVPPAPQTPHVHRPDAAPPPEHYLTHFPTCSRCAHCRSCKQHNQPARRLPPVPDHVTLLDNLVKQNNGVASVHSVRSFTDCGGCTSTLQIYGMVFRRARHAFASRTRR